MRTVCTFAITALALATLHFGCDSERKEPGEATEREDLPNGAGNEEQLGIIEPVVPSQPVMPEAAEPEMPPPTEADFEDVAEDDIDEENLSNQVDALERELGYGGDVEDDLQDDVERDVNQDLEVSPTN